MIYIRCKVDASLLIVESDKMLIDPRILNANGSAVNCKILKHEAKELILDASELEKWSPGHPVCYTLKAEGISERFGFCELKTLGNSDILLNGERCFMRGVIRGIVAHDHPNMTGCSLKEAAEKYIRQAKKYGFNLVRFHSTIPPLEFVEAADELGLFIHMEIGFAYEYDKQGNKKKLSMDNENWRNTILRYRNHPSVAIFCIGNEMHKAGHQIEVHSLYAQGKALAPDKLIMDNSGWGEYDRPTADVYSQHIAYYFPCKHHAKMFKEDNCWRLNGSTYDVPLDEENQVSGIITKIRREAVPLKPVLAHEAMHYIEIPDYVALNKKFDEFCARVGEKYLQNNQIEKPRYLTELPELIKKKGLAPKMEDYIRGSQEFKKLAIKLYIEQLRHSQLCGFEMLQLADTLKYENKNGIIDCFDDDKYIDPDWMNSFNGDAALLAEFENETFYHGSPVKVIMRISNFLSQPNITGNLHLSVNGCEVWNGKHLTLTGGLQTLAKIEFKFPDSGKAQAMKLTATFNGGNITLQNSWNFWLYPVAEITASLQTELADGELAKKLPQNSANSNLVVCDILTDKIFSHLEHGKTVILFYHRDNPGSQYYWPGALERFKPCIWDRGSNLGGVINSEYLRNQLASERYFDLNMQELLEGGYKICLDDFPVPVEEFIFGIDKPVRDRMKGLLQGVKDFIPEDTLRNFSHLFSLRAGKGLLIVSTLKITGKYAAAVSANLLSAIINHPEQFNTDKSIELETLRNYLATQTKAGFRKEDVMNHFWEIDNKPVEDTLFWEQAGIDLSKLH